MSAYSPSGLQAVPHLSWGSHLTQFFGSGTELRDLLVPYFKAGLENNERCLWVTSAAFNADDARSALRAAVPDLDRRERDRQIEIANAGDWYASDQKLEPQELVSGLLKREEEALGLGYAGVRTNGNCAWVSPAQWADFQDYEARVQKAVRGRRLICLCSYCHDQLQDGAHADVMARHDIVLGGAAAETTVARSRRNTPVQDALHEHDLRRQLERQQQTFDLAMIASQMGTWRYTLADNICVYDENAQRLYGLSEARFLHDDAGVRAKFHSDDLELMWSRVGKALDPRGDGRYDVEYRVKQLDGSWRWLSAWGLVEFEDQGGEKKAVAIAGASRDLTERKQAEERQYLLTQELNHRVKNTLAIVQSIAGQTLRNAPDLSSAGEALDRRIESMGRAHDLLTARTWTGANLADIVVRALNSFSPQATISGPALDVSPKHTLALSLALHELATNATKYGALSSPTGRVHVKWAVTEGMLQLDWEEDGGPPVAAPVRGGFGSRLIDILVRDLGGDLKLTYEPSGVRCSFTAPL